MTLEDARRAFREEAVLLSEILSKKQGSNSQDENSYLSSSDVQRELRLSKATLARWRNEGLIGFSKVLGKLLYRREDIENLVQSHVVTKGDARHDATRDERAEQRATGE